MNHRSGALRLWALLLLAFTSYPAAASPLPGPVVSAQWLNAHRDAVVILDVRDDLDSFTRAPAYEVDEQTKARVLVGVGGRIPGALPVDFAAIRVDRKLGQSTLSKMLPDAQTFERLMRTAGLPAGRPIVIASTGDAPDQIEQATRLYWTLRVFGAQQVAILDGGVAAWLEQGYPVTTEAAPAGTGDWRAQDPQAALISSADDVRAAIGKRQIVDARPLPQFLGLQFKKPTVLYGGHIQGARNFPTDVRYRTRGIAQHFLTPGEYRYAMAAQAIDPDAPTITYCNTGHLASGLWFIFHGILDNGDVRLFDGSMHEWTTLGYPVVGPDT
ncbi:sulfurtransferase [Sinimarinibacterium thermocellulolyticum]|uniref:Rhodanese-like domain-containing protein n=1 Tax=Sinimarinibacterium thermocellulolyticum TaxID=3170016 RepID=A0ABV2ADL0_9GAMM